MGWPVSQGVGAAEANAPPQRINPPLPRGQADAQNAGRCSPATALPAAARFRSANGLGSASRRESGRAQLARVAEVDRVPRHVLRGRDDVLLLCLPKDGAEIFERLGGLPPSCLKRPLTRAGKRWRAKEEEAMDREAETGEAVSCAVLLDGVPLCPDGDEEACWASSGTVSGADGTRLKTLSFGPETGKTTLVAVADAAHDNWTFLGKLRPDERAVDFFHACERLGEVAGHAVATDWYGRATLRDARRRQGRHYLRDKATTKTATAVLEREVLPQAQAPHALREPQGQGLRLRRRPRTRCWSTSA